MEINTFLLISGIFVLGVPFCYSLYVACEFIVETYREKGLKGAFWYAWLLIAVFWWIAIITRWCFWILNPM